MVLEGFIGRISQRDFLTRQEIEVKRPNPTIGKLDFFPCQLVRMVCFVKLCRCFVPVVRAERPRLILERGARGSVALGLSLPRGAVFIM